MENCKGGFPMVIDAETLEKSLNEYIAIITQNMPIDKAYLFGSYATGTPHEWSDIDICLFSDYFGGKDRIELGVQLLSYAHSFYPDVVFEPHVFPTSELYRDNPFVKEVLRTGREIKIKEKA
jgi:predicted nucleotidyltransferase